VLTDVALRGRLSKGARRFAERFSWDRAAEDTDAHLRQVLASGASWAARGSGGDGSTV
jgi:hypothetical protein